MRVHVTHSVSSSRFDDDSTQTMIRPRKVFVDPVLVRINMIILLVVVLGLVFTITLIVGVHT
ncbi:hypothetical protein EVAR_95566_1, partial [Eumeta japonica]